MPMIDAHIPEGALQPDAEARLLEELTDILIRLEGFDPKSERARAATWTFVYRPEVFVAGKAPELPRYRFIVSVPEGQFDDDRRSSVVTEMTAAVARAEDVPFADVGSRVWIFPIEIPDGQWGSRGVVQHLPDIIAFLAGEHKRECGHTRLAVRRLEAATAMLKIARLVADGN